MDLASFRKEKDAFFREPDSPLSDEQRKAFLGLQYFPENPELRFTLPLDTSAGRSFLTLQTSTGEQRQYERAGTVVFSVKGQSVTLWVYQDEHGYFLPFRDGTCENESYPAGRYVEPEEHEGKLLVDFNLAYNPYCAYTERFSCPIPPRENWTPVRIEAGEKKFHA